MPSRRRLVFHAPPAHTVAATLATGILLALFLAILSLPHDQKKWEPPQPGADPFATPHELNGYLFTLVPYEDTSRQRQAHAFVTLLVGVLVVGGSLGRFRCRCDGRLSNRITLTVSGLFLLVWLWVCVRYPAARFLQPRTLAESVLLLFLVRLLISRQKGVYAWIGWSTIVGAWLLATVPALFTHVDLTTTSWDDVGIIQHHFALVLGQADRLAAGQVLFDEVEPAYGILLHALAAGYQRFVHFLTMGDYVRLQQAINFVYVGLAIYLYARYARTRWIYVMLALAFVLPWNHGFDHSLLYPNMSAWRVASYPLVLLCLWHMGRWSFGPTALAGGALAAASILLNPESGVAAAVGIMTYLFFRHLVPATRPLHRSAALAFLLMLGALAVSLLFMALCRLLLDYWPRPEGFLLLFGNALFRAGTGLGGVTLTGGLWGALPFVAFFHAVLVLLKAAWMPRARHVQRECFRAAVAGILVVWFAYYFNRPHPWHISSVCLLYGFFFIDLLRLAMFGLRHGRFWKAWVLPTYAGLILVVCPSLVLMMESGYYFFEQSPCTTNLPSAEKGVKLSGVYFDPVVGTQILQVQTDALKALAKHGSPMYFTALSYLVPSIARVFPPLPMGDVCFETLDRRRYRQLLAYIVASPAQEIYFDSHPLAPWSGFYEQMRLDLADHFARQNVSPPGWHTWVRKQ